MTIRRCSWECAWAQIETRRSELEKRWPSLKFPLVECARLPIKPDGPRSDSRRHRVGPVRLLFPGVACRNTLAESYASRPLVSGRCCSASGSRPGPASARSARASPCEVTRTDGSPRVVLAAAHPKWGGGAVSRLDGRGISLSTAPMLPTRTHGARPNTHKPAISMQSPGPVPRISNP